MNRPIKFLPYFKSTIWGGEEISRFKAMNSNCTNIGESWELSCIPNCESIVADGPDAGMTLSAMTQKYQEQLLGNNVVKKYGNTFPLLIKFIDARQDLSLQVHPDDALAMKRHNSLGKTEMWYILGSADGAKIHTGLTHAITPEEYTERVAKGNLMEVVGSYDSAPGDIYFLPAGRIHAIGAGNFLIEIQESSDITYRVDDYGRRDANGNLRELHTELAKDAIDYKYYPDCKTFGVDIDKVTKKLVTCEYFDVNRETVTDKRTIANPADSFMAVSCLTGVCEIAVGANSVAVKQGDTLLIPAVVDAFDVTGNATLLTVVVP
jgi:mannose-6-phosphate isomerase